MSEQPNDGGPAFPFSPNDHSTANYLAEGMSLRTYAAIKLCVPDSGLPWLDDMIRQAQRDKFAGQALAGMLADPEMNAEPKLVARVCYNYADAMLAAREVQP